MSLYEYFVAVVLNCEKYRFEILTSINGKDKLHMFFDSGYDLVWPFLSSDVQRGFNKFYLKYIDMVLNEELKYYELRGNVYELEIHKEYTKITDSLAFEYLDEERVNWVKTDELRAYIILWTEEQQKFHDDENYFVNINKKIIQ